MKEKYEKNFWRKLRIKNIESNRYTRYWMSGSITSITKET